MIHEITHVKNRRIWPTRITNEFDQRELPTRKTHKFYHEFELQQLPTGLTHETYRQDARSLVHSQIILKILLLWKLELW